MGQIAKLKLEDIRTMKKYYVEVREEIIRGFGIEAESELDAERIVKTGNFESFCEDYDPIPDTIKLLRIEKW